MIIRAKAPLRVGLAGGGTDVSPYSDQYGGAILNATINMFAYATIESRTDGLITFNAIDQDSRLSYPVNACLPVDGRLDLLAGVYNRIISEFNCSPFSFELSTYVDAPPGSGLGSSSTLVVAILTAFVEWFKLPLGEYDIAHLAWDIERNDLGMAGGKQDQYAATFGGFNFMEFSGNDKVIVNPLRIKQDLQNELEFCLLLYYTGTSRLSSSIIESQSSNVRQNLGKTVQAMDRLKEQAVMMKEAILKGNLGSIGAILDFGWKYKKDLAANISNSLIDEIYSAALAAGASGGKISGAGGGGFIMFYCPGNSRYAVIESLKKFGGEFRRFQFTSYGVQTWLG